MEALDQVGINLGYLIGYTGGVVLLIVILRAFAYEPIVNLMEERKERIAEGLNKEREASEALASAEADKQQMLDEARREAQQMVNEARTRAEESANKIKADAQQEAENIVADAQQKAERQQEAALGDMRDQIIDLSIAAAQSIVGKLDEGKQRELVEQFFTEIPEGAKDFGGDVIVTTAVPLTDAEKEEAEAEFTNADAVHFNVNPDMLGGVIVRSGAQEVDSSFRSQLTSMRTSLG